MGASCKVARHRLPLESKGSSVSLTAVLWRYPAPSIERTWRLNGEEPPQTPFNGNQYFATRA
jgi:hypothetical protein